jgi:S-(hydroxymethyl)glutathione dehydrogenase/alcohol dehydrogenase
VTPAGAVRGRGLVLPALGEVPILAELEFLPPGPGEIRARVLAAGLCHTDLAARRDARSTPLVLGHEGVGVVESVGSGVDGLTVGDRVLFVWKVPCGTCRRCAQARPQLCLSPRSTAEPRVRWRGAPIDLLLDTGCFASHVVLPAGGAVPIPRGLSPERAALVGCAVATGVGAALWTARVEPGDDVAVWGAGGVGLNVVAGAALAAARVVIAIDPDPERRRAATDCGATHVAGPGQARGEIAKATDGRGVDHAFEVVGEPAVMADAIDALAVGGQLVLVGAAAREALLSFAPRRFMSRQQRIAGCIYGSLRPSADLPLLLAWCRDGVLPLDRLDGARISLDALPAAFARPPAGIRTVVTIGAESG